MSAVLMSIVGVLVAGAPEIVEVQPTPLPLAATVEITGSGFIDRATSVKIGETAERVVLVEPQRLRFLVALDTPLGAQTLVVTTQGEGGGTAQADVVVVPAVPQIQNVEPEVLTLGGLATVIGEGLATVTAATLDGQACAVSEQTDFVMVLEVPFDAQLLGSARLLLESPSGAVAEDVVVAAPRPEIDALVPNPVRAGALVTVRGHIAAIGLPTVAIAAVEVPVVGVAAGPSGSTEITAWVPASFTPKPYDVVVTSGSESSLPAGPLIVEERSAQAPEVDGVYPVRVAAGGDVWVAGAFLDGIEEVTGGFELVECRRRGCLLGTAGIEGGTVTGAVVGPDGAGVVAVEVVAEEPVTPVLAAVEPSPAFRGQTLVIRGERLAGVRSVVLGGVPQSIAFVDGDRVEVTLSAMTPLGAEPLFVSGNTASAALMVTVLDALPPVAESGPEASDGAEVVVVESGAELEAPGGGGGDGGGDGGDGCAGGGSPSAPGILVVLVLVVVGRLGALCWRSITARGSDGGRGADTTTLI